MSATPTPMLARFWRRVDTSAGFDGCWEWQGAKTAYGYGAIGAGGRGDGIRLVHRVALEQHLGRPLGAGMCACHHCDNPPCVNPLHLFEGTKGDNNRDMAAKGRHVGTRGKKLPSRRRAA